MMARRGATDGRLAWTSRHHFQQRSSTWLQDWEAIDSSELTLSMIQKSMDASSERYDSKLRIGITIGLFSESETLWNNGIKQNAIFLLEALRQCPNVASVSLVNTTAVPLTGALPWDLARWPVISLEQAKDEVDVMVELGGQVSSALTEHLKVRGARLVSYCCGFEYVHAMESMLFGRPLWGDRLFINQRYDAIWMVPQVDNISRHYFQTLRRKPAQVVPFVWSPVILEERVRQLPIAAEYAPSGRAKRLTIMEPNHDVAKFCLYPVLIAEEAYRQRPDSISYLHVTNAERLAIQSPEFVSLMAYLDIVRDRKASFVGRFDTPVFLAEHTDIVVSHQWENPLNYFYFDVCWLGYPLVHNASLCSDLGYYYEGNDVRAGADVLLRVIDRHDEAWEGYADRQRHLIHRYAPGNPQVIAAYTELLSDLMKSPSD